MFKNYFYLNRCAIELDLLLKDETVHEAFTQERDKLYLNIGSDEYLNRHLIISTDPSLSYINVKNEHHKAKKNTTNFFENFLPDRIEKVLIAINDRVIKISMVKSTIFFFVRGSRTNILLINTDGEIHEFKRMKSQNPIELRDELMGLSYIDYFNLVNLNKSVQPADKSTTPHISKEIKIEAEARGISKESPQFDSEIENIIKEISSKNIAVFYSEELHKPIMCPESFKTFNLSDNFKSFDNYSDSLNLYLSLKFRNETISKVKVEIDKYLSRETERLSNKLNDLSTRIENGSKDEIYKHYADLLLSNLHLLKKGMDEVELTDYITGDKVIIKLDPKKTPQKLVDYYFDKSRDERINYNKSVTLFNDSETKYNNLILIRNVFDSAESLDEFLEIKKKLKLGTKEKLVKHMDKQIKYRHFILEDKFHVYVGRDNVNNDLLTFKFAKQNDYWFHARSVSGSHIILRIDNPKEGIPKNILKSTASIAAFYSKAKTSNMAPVSYTFRKFVRKSKGMPAGQVLISKEKVLIVKPEIPKNAEQLEE